MAHGTAANSIELTGDTRLFDRVARKWNVDYAFYKTGPDKYLLFFKSGQADAMTACFSEYSRKVLNKTKSHRIPIRDQLKRASEQLTHDKAISGNGQRRLPMPTDKIRKYILPNIPYLFIGWAFLKLGTAYRLAAGANAGEKLLGLMQTIGVAFADFSPGLDPLTGWLALWALCLSAADLFQKQKSQKISAGRGIRLRPVECIILSVNDTYMDAQEVMHMTDYSKITALYSRLSVGDEDRDGGESNSIQNQKIFLENYARGQHLTNIRHYIDDDESGRFFDRSAYSRMMDDVENGKIGVCIMKDLTRWGRDYLQVGNAMEIFRRNNVRFIAVNNGIDSEKPDTLEFAPFINIMSEWYAKDISKKVKTGIKTKGMSGKPIVTEAPYGYVKDPDNKDFWIIDEEAAEVVRLIFHLFIGGKTATKSPYI